MQRHFRLHKVAGRSARRTPAGPDPAPGPRPGPVAGVLGAGTGRPGEVEAEVRPGQRPVRQAADERHVSMAVRMSLIFIHINVENGAGKQRMQVVHWPRRGLTANASDATSAQRSATPSRPRRRPSTSPAVGAARPACGRTGCSPCRALLVSTHGPGTSVTDPSGPTRASVASRSSPASDRCPPSPAPARLSRRPAPCSGRSRRRGRGRAVVDQHRQFRDVRVEQVRGRQQRQQRRLGVVVEQLVAAGRDHHRSSTTNGGRFAASQSRNATSMFDAVTPASPDLHGVDRDVVTGIAPRCSARNDAGGLNTLQALPWCSARSATRSQYKPC